MNKEELAEMINRIGPKRLFPVHTENSELFKEITHTENMVKGKQYRL
jgi:mRNA degradation ribonuclease J1/J2